MSYDEMVWWACGALFVLLLAIAGGAPRDDEDDTQDIGW
jgi:hypothetical protein